MVRLVHAGDGKQEEIEVYTVNIGFASGNELETDVTGFTFDTLGDNMVGLIDENTSTIPHLSINMNNVDYIYTALASEYGSEEDTQLDLFEEDV